MSIEALPPELYSCILSHVSSSDLQTATLSLSRAVPLSPVPLHSLFEHIILSRQQQVSQLYRRLCYHPTSRSIESFGDATLDKERAWVKSVTLQTWQVDADIFVNLLALLSGIERLSLMVGTVFAPEHLEDIFRRQVLALKVLSIRFRPYVQRATYYQFLKGSYFDGTVELLSHWPARLSHLSIIQDPLPPLPAESLAKSFAQPIVFFSLAPLTTLSISSASQNITHLRLRIPSRQLVRFIYSSKGSAVNNASHFPSLTYLDLSTCTVRDFSDVEALLIQTGRGRLKHIVLDKTGLCNGNEGEWESLGRSCALAGVKRMREREKVLKAWIEAETATRNHSQDIPGPGALVGAAEERRPRRGRRGLATATISLRDAVPQGIPALPAAHPATRSGRASNTAKIRILPPPPRLLSLSTGVSRPLGHPHSEDMGVHEAKARSDFSKGWSEGLSQLRAIWARLRQSQSNGVRVVRFDADRAGGSDTLNGDLDMFEGLKDMGKPNTDEYWEELREIEPPILCFAGARGEERDKDGNDETKWPGHPEGCGHRIAWDAWQDNL